MNKKKPISISTQTTTSTSMSTSKSRKPQVNPFQSLMKVERLWEKKLPAKRIQRLHSKIHCSFQFSLLWRRCYLKWQKRYSWFFFRLDFCLSPCLQAASQSCLCGKTVADVYMTHISVLWLYLGVYEAENKRNWNVLKY